MTKELTRAEFRFCPDAHLVLGVVAAAEHFGQRRHLDDAAVQSLVRATQEACLSTFKLLSGDAPTLGVVIIEFDDRIEMTIEHQGEALPTAGLDTFLDAVAEDAPSDELSGFMLMTLVDRVQYQTVEGTQRMTLVKNAPSASPKK
jgi:anti-sigma regulatory factor (Ser/Thr protein kinase)